MLSTITSHTPRFAPFAGNALDAVVRVRVAVAFTVEKDQAP